MAYIVTRVSCGFLIQVGKQFLFCKPTGSKFLDLPKGLKERDESHMQAALRELREETGIVLGTSGFGVRDLGEEPYNKQKNLHLFHIKLPTLELEQLWCESLAPTRWGTVEPEVRGYTLCTLTEAWEHLPISMRGYLLKKSSIIDDVSWPSPETLT